jgi:hypothetical protein
MKPKIKEQLEAKRKSLSKQPHKRLNTTIINKLQQCTKNVRFGVNNGCEVGGINGG